MLQLNGRVIKTDSIQTKKSVGGFESCSCSHIQCSLTTSHEICQARKEKKKKMSRSILELKKQCPNKDLLPMRLFITELSCSNEQRVGVNTSISQVI